MAGKSGARVFTEKDKAEALAVLAANNGLIKRAARDLNINPATLRRWRDQQSNRVVLQQRGDGGQSLAVVPPTVPHEAVGLAAGTFADHAERIRDKALRQLEAQIDAGLVPANHLVNVIGMLDDKATRARGLATEIVERRDSTPEEVRNLVTEAMQQVIAAAARREMEIDGADLVDELPE